MFKTVVYYVFIVSLPMVVICADICYTPDGDIGECVPLLYCSDLLQPVLDPAVANKSFLIDSACKNGNETSITVCCSVIKGRFKIDILDKKDRQTQEIVLAPTSLKNSKDCGIQNRQSSDNADGLASLDEFPWLVYILTVSKSEDGTPEHSIACTGTLINSRNVLSSAQCLINAGGESAAFLVGIDELAVQNRTFYELESCNNGNCSGFHYYDLDNILIHPSFDELSNLHDIALLKLNASTLCTDHIRPACLPLPEFKTAKPGDLLYTAGYTTWSSKVKSTSNLISTVGCKVIHKRRNISKSITGYDMCGIKSEDGHCDDESAGNAVLFFDDERWYIDGIFSWSENCSQSNPKIYTRVSSYLQWIEVNIRDVIKNGESEDVPVTLQNPQNCGYQRQDKYNTTDGPISPDEFPWMTYILATIDNSSEFYDYFKIVCTGSLITSRYVLCGAQCLVDNTDPSTEFFVAIDEFRVQDTTNCTEFTPSHDSNCSTLSYYELIDVVIHPSYNRWTYENDIALLRLNDIVTFTDYIRPLCLPLPGFKSAGSGDTLQVSSYTDWNVKTKASVMLITNKECMLKIKQMNDTQLVHKHEMCAVKSNNAVRITWHQDIGAPAVYSNNNRWHLEALESRGCNCSNSPTIYTRVADYLPWIQVNIKDDRCITPNGNMGECIPLRLCSELLQSFTNPKKEQEKYLRKFICKNGTKSDFMVCCPRVMDIFTFQSEEEESKPSESYLQTELQNFESCGLQRKSTYEPKDGIIPEDEFPWLANIISYAPFKDDDDFDWYWIRCTGALISARYVVASAECLTEDDPSITIFYVKIVEYSDEDTTNCTENTFYYEYNCTANFNFGIDETIIHPFYNQWTSLNNIALLRLDIPVHFFGYIKPICLHLPGTETIHQQEVLYTAGYTEWVVRSKAALRLVPNSQCTRIFNQRNQVASITKYEMCTTKSKSAAEVTCDHFIGSPAMSFSNNRWYLEGIHSKGDTCTNRVPTVYTRVTNYLQWIHEHTSPENCTTPHGEPGMCKQIENCPQLLDAFTNPEKRNDGKVDPYLRSFECPPSTKADKSIGDAIIVCCGVSPNFTIRQMPDYKDLEKKNAIEFDNSLYCGLQHKDDYYSASDDISIDEFPWSAAIYLYDTTAKKKKRILCIGTLISRKYVLTATSCLQKIVYWDRYIIRTSKIINSNKRESTDFSFITIRVRLGEYNVRNTTDCISFPEIGSEYCTTAQEYEVYRPTIHSFYVRLSGFNNIALLRLDKEVEFSDYVRPICLPSPGVPYVKPGDTLYSTGWSETINSVSVVTGEVELKKKIRTTLITDEECSEILDNIYVNQFCTRDYRNSTQFLCDLDVGSPIMTKYKHKWYVIGITSETACKYDQPQVHTNVTTYLGWILRAVEFD